MAGTKRNTSILLIGTNLAGLSRIAGKVTRTLRNFDPTWDPEYQCASTFNAALEMLRIGLKPNVIFITDESGNITYNDLRTGCVRLAYDLKVYGLRSWIAIEDEMLTWLIDIFKDRNISAYYATIVEVAIDEEAARESPA